MLRSRAALAPTRLRRRPTGLRGPQLLRRAHDAWGTRHPPDLRIVAIYFFLGWSATAVPPPGITRFSALNQMLAMTR
jgi:hypothetical protein